jgi:hypothetical protein
MGGIIGEYEQCIKINGELYKYVFYGLFDNEIKDRLEHIRQLQTGERTDIPKWLYKN